MRIYLATESVDLRKGPDGLAALVKRAFEEPLFSGHLFVFLSKRSDRIKILWWDRGGFVVFYKRLERGRFRRPEVRAESRSVSMTPAELSSLLEGIDLSRARRTLLWEPSQRKGIDTANPM